MSTPTRGLTQEDVDTIAELTSRRPNREDEEDVLAATRLINLQNLSAVTNNPSVSFVDSLFELSTAYDSANPVIPRPTLEDVDINSFAAYLGAIEVPYLRLQELEKSEAKEAEQRALELGIEIDAESLSVIPTEYLQEELDVVSQVVSLLDQDPLLQQQKLSHYLDLVEMELLKQISARFDSFFSALTTMQNLHREIAIAVTQIANLRRGVRQLDAELVHGPLQIASLLRRRSNLSILCEKMELVRSVHKAQPHLQLLLSQSDYGGALDLISTTEDVLRGELSNITPFRHYSMQLSEMTTLIENLMRSDFIAYTLDWRDSVTGERGQGLASGKATGQITTSTVEVPDQLVPLVLGLLRSGKMPSILQHYRDRLQREVTGVVKDILTVSLPDPTPGRASLADRLGSLSPTEFLAVVQNVFNGLLSLLHHAARIHAILLAVFEAAADQDNSGQADDDSPSNTTTTTTTSTTSTAKATDWVKGDTGTSENTDSLLGHYRRQLSRDSLDLLASIAELTHARVARLIEVRRDVGSHLSVEQFFGFYSAAEAFIQESETLCSRQCISLKGVLKQMGKAVIESFHHKRIDGLTLVLESERWQQSKVPQEFQNLVDMLAGTASTTTSLPVSSTSSATNGNGASDSTNGGTSEVLRMLTVGGNRYRVVNSVLILLQTITKYLDLCKRLPHTTIDVIPKLVQTLKFFNSRACQLVVGAGALTTAGLKSISTKHLALASQSLGAVQALIPLIGHTMTKLLPESYHRLLSDLTRLTKDYHDHRQEINHKFASILKDRLDVHCRALEQGSWENDPANTADACAYMHAITNDIGALHRVLKGVLPPSELQTVFATIIPLIYTRLIDQYGTVPLTTERARDRIVNDVGYLMTTVGQLEGLSVDNTALVSYCRALHQQPLIPPVSLGAPGGSEGGGVGGGDG